MPKNESIKEMLQRLKREDEELDSSSEEEEDQEEDHSIYSSAGDSSSEEDEEQQNTADYDDEASCLEEEPRKPSPHSSPTPNVQLEDDQSSLSLSSSSEDDDEDEDSLEIQISSKLSTLFAEAKRYDESLNSRINSIFTEASTDASEINVKLSALLSEMKGNVPSPLLKSGASVGRDSEEEDISDSSSSEEEMDSKPAARRSVFSNKKENSSKEKVSSEEDSSEEEDSSSEEEDSSSEEEDSSSEEEKDSKPAARKVVIDPNSRIKANRTKEARRKADQANANNKKRRQTIKKKYPKKYQKSMTIDNPKIKAKTQRHTAKLSAFRKRDRKSSKPYTKTTFENYPGVKKQLYQDVYDRKNNCHAIEADNIIEFADKLVRRYRVFPEEYPEGMADITASTVISTAKNFGSHEMLEARAEFGLL